MLITDFYLWKSNTVKTNNNKKSFTLEHEPQRSLVMRHGIYLDIEECINLELFKEGKQSSWILVKLIE